MKKTESSYIFIWVRSITIVAETAQQTYVGIFFITNLQGHMTRRNMGPKEVSSATWWDQRGPQQD